MGEPIGKRLKRGNPRRRADGDFFGLRVNCNLANDGVDDYTLAVMVGRSGVEREQILDLQVRKQEKIMVRRVSMTNPLNQLN